MLSSCRAHDDTPSFSATEAPTSEETTSDDYKQGKYSLNYIFKDNISAEEQKKVIEEAENAILEVNQILGVDLAEKFDCVFDSSYKNAKGQSRSEAKFQDKIIYCVEYTAFVHEYIHMLLNLSPDRIYNPNAILIEGTATYFSSVWGEKYGNNYEHLYDGDFGRFPDVSEDEAICKKLEEQNLPLTDRNYFNATVATISKMVGFDKCQTLDGEFVNYRIGSVTVEYLITQCGGVEKFLSVYFDSIRVPDEYEKSLEDIIIDALKWNAESYFPASIHILTHAN